MFTLHESTRRGLCRMGFFFLCVLPICAIVAAHFWVHSDLRRRECEAELSQFLGLKVSLVTLSSTHPYGLRYDGLQLSDPETGVVIAKAGAVDIRRFDRELIVQVVDSEINSQNLDSLADTVIRQLRLATPGQSTTFHAKKLNLILPHGSEKQIEDVTAKIDTVKNVELNVQFRPVNRLAGPNRSEGAVTLKITRNRQTLPPTTSLVLNTQGNQIPCALASTFTPFVARLGHSAEFSGLIILDTLARDCKGTLQGEFKQVDLAELSMEQSLPQIKGKATARIVEARVDSGKLAVIEGDLASGPGSIQGGLVDRMAKVLRLQGPDGADGSLPYSELKFAFRMDDTGFKVLGRCASGAMLADARGNPLLSVPRVTDISLIAIAESFARSGGTIIGLLPSASYSPRR